jgi:hypothetical protein
MRLKKTIYILLSLTILLISTSCNTTSVETISETSIQTKIEAQTEPAIEYKTIEPPEDGWTLELLNEVTYINGKDIDLPFCLNDLGEDFTISEVQKANTNETCSGNLCYKGKSAMYAISSTAGEEFDRNDKIDYLLMLKNENLSSLDLSDFISINGINFNTTMNEFSLLFGNQVNVNTNSLDEQVGSPQILRYITDSSRIMISFSEDFSDDINLSTPTILELDMRGN